MGGLCRPQSKAGASSPPRVLSHSPTPKPPALPRAGDTTRVLEPPPAPRLPLCVRACRPRAPSLSKGHLSTRTGLQPPSPSSSAVGWPRGEQRWGTHCSCPRSLGTSGLSGWQHPGVSPSPVQIWGHRVPGARCCPHPDQGPLAVPSCRGTGGGGTSAAQDTRCQPQRSAVPWHLTLSPACPLRVPAAAPPCPLRLPCVLPGVPRVSPGCRTSDSCALPAPALHVRPAPSTCPGPPRPPRAPPSHAAGRGRAGDTSQLPPRAPSSHGPPPTAPRSANRPLGGGGPG